MKVGGHAWYCADLEKGPVRVLILSIDDSYAQHLKNRGFITARTADGRTIKAYQNQFCASYPAAHKYR